MLIHFENYELDGDRRELRRDGQLVEMEPKVFDLLAYVIANRDRVVSRDDLIATVWVGRIVSDSALATMKDIPVIRLTLDSSLQKTLEIRLTRTNLRMS